MLNDLGRGDWSGPRRFKRVRDLLRFCATSAFGADWAAVGAAEAASCGSALPETRAG